MVLSALAFAFMQIIIAQTADTIPLFEQLIFRNSIAALVAGFFAKKQKLLLIGKPENRMLLLFRSLFGFFGMLTLFYASANANQGDVAIITKMTPFVTIICVSFLLKEKIKLYQFFSVSIAFIGAAIVSGAQFNSSFIPLVSAAFSTVFGGIAYSFVSSLRGKENPWVIVFFFSTFSTILCLPMLLMNFVIPSASDFILLLLIGIFAAIGQILLTKAYASAKAGDVSVFNYFGIIFSMILGYVFLGQAVPITSAIGAILVIGAGAIVFIAARSEKK